MAKEELDILTNKIFGFYAKTVEFSEVIDALANLEEKLIVRNSKASQLHQAAPLGNIGPTPAMQRYGRRLRKYTEATTDWACAYGKMCLQEEIEAYHSINKN